MQSTSQPQQQLRREPPWTPREMARFLSQAAALHRDFEACREQHFDAIATLDDALAATSEASGDSDDTCDGGEGGCGSRVAAVDPTAHLPRTPRGSASFAILRDPTTASDADDAPGSSTSISVAARATGGNPHHNRQRGNARLLRGRRACLSRRALELGGRCVQRAIHMAAVQAAVEPLTLPQSCLAATASQLLLAQHLVAQQCIVELGRAGAAAVRARRRNLVVGQPADESEEGNVRDVDGDGSFPPFLPPSLRFIGLRGCVDQQQQQQQQQQDDGLLRGSEHEWAAQLRALVRFIAEAMSAGFGSVGVATGALLRSYDALVLQGDAPGAVRILASADEQLAARRDAADECCHRCFSHEPLPAAAPFGCVWGHRVGDRHCLESLAHLVRGAFTDSVTSATAALAGAEALANSPVGWLSARGKRTRVLALLLRSEARRAAGAVQAEWTADAREAVKATDEAKRYAGILSTVLAEHAVHPRGPLPPIVHRLCMEFCGGVSLSARSEAEHASYFSADGRCSVSCSEGTDAGQGGSSSAEGGGGGGGAAWSALVRASAEFGGPVRDTMFDTCPALAWRAMRIAFSDDVEAIVAGRVCLSVPTASPSLGQAPAQPQPQREVPLRVPSDPRLHTAREWLAQLQQHRAWAEVERAKRRGSIATPAAPQPTIRGRPSTPAPPAAAVPVHFSAHHDGAAGAAVVSARSEQALRSRRVRSFTFGRMRELRRASQTHGQPGTPCGSAPRPSAEQVHSEQQQETKQELLRKRQKQRLRPASATSARLRNSLGPGGGSTRAMRPAACDGPVPLVGVAHAGVAAASLVALACAVLYTRPRRLAEEAERTRRARRQHVEAARANQKRAAMMAEHRAASSGPALASLSPTVALGAGAPRRPQSAALASRKKSREPKTDAAAAVGQASRGPKRPSSAPAMRAAHERPRAMSPPMCAASALAADRSANTAHTRPPRPVSAASARRTSMAGLAAKMEKATSVRPKSAMQAPKNHALAAGQTHLCAAEDRVLGGEGSGGGWQPWRHSGAVGDGEDDLPDIYEDDGDDSSCSADGGDVAVNPFLVRTGADTPRATATTRIPAPPTRVVPPRPTRLY